VITDGGRSAVGGGSGKVVDVRDGYGERVGEVAGLVGIGVAELPALRGTPQLSGLEPHQETEAYTDQQHHDAESHAPTLGRFGAWL
jgi:hypothetical protein